GEASSLPRREWRRTAISVGVWYRPSQVRILPRQPEIDGVAFEPLATLPLSAARGTWRRRGMRERLLQKMPALNSAVRDQPHARNDDVEENGDPRRNESRGDAERVKAETGPFLRPRSDDC